MPAVVIVVLLVACGRQPAVHSPRAGSCYAGRVGTVTIAGGTVDDVPQLAVLEGTLDDAARAERVRLAAIDALHARGYPRAAVSIARRAGCGIELAVSVVRGPRFRIAAIEFATSADDAFPAAQRAAVIEDGLGMVNAIGGAYVEDRLVRALDVLLRRYQRAGWRQASIEPPRAAYDEARGEVRVTIAIHAGART